MTSRLTISVSDDVRDEIRARAAELGMDVSNYVEQLAHRDYQEAQLREAFTRRGELGLDREAEERARIAWRILHPEHGAA